MSMLKPIPGNSKNPIDSLYANQQMALDAMAQLHFCDLIHIVASHIEARPDIDPKALETFANEIGLFAHMKAREGK